MEINRLKKSLESKQLKNIISLQNKNLFLFCSVLFLATNIGTAQNNFPDIIKTKEGKLSFTTDNQGNQIPDFSFAGYRNSEVAIPNLDNKIFVSKQEEDATQKIQNAIDYVSALKPDKSGFRGAVLLDKGTFKISGTLYIRKSGVVLRGSGNTENGTVLLGTGLEREALIRILGENDKVYKDSFEFANAYTPLGTQKIQLKNTSKKNPNSK